MGAAPPYLYDNRSPYNEFNPRAYTQASYTSLPSQRPKSQGPLISFNQHPDSYMVVGYGQHAKPMPPNTKKKVVVTRWVQFGLRCFQLLGALGLLVCVICIKGTDNASGWMIRVPPAWDAIITTYAVYHLLRPAKGRTPASSASYHFFAVFMDGGLIPFYVFMAMLSEANWAEAPGTTGRWRSFFEDNTVNWATNTILESAWIIATVVGALHLISVFLDVYLIIMFRRIARLPPDMSPLEDNLTSRASKHKHKNSEMSASTMSLSEKKLSNISGSTLNLYSPNSLSSPAARQVPFSHSRQDSDAAFSPHTLESARQSRINLNSQASFYSQPISERTSRADMQPQRPQSSHSRPQSQSHSRPQSRSHSRSRSQSRSRPSSFPNQNHDPMPERITSPFSFVSAQSEQQSRHSTPQPGPQSAIPSSTATAQQKQGLLSDNWYVADDASDAGAGSLHCGLTPLEQEPPNLQQQRPHDEQAHRYSQQERTEILPNPLSSNPPVPPKSKQRYYAKRQQSAENGEDIGRALTMGSSVYSDAVSVKNGSNNPMPKNKHYGDLASATAGVRGASGGGAQQQQSPERRSQYASDRAFSRTGADIADANVLYFNEERGRAGGRNGRNVSGKNAEEGMAGNWGMRKREVSGFA